LNALIPISIIIATIILYLWVGLRDPCPPPKMYRNPCVVLKRKEVKKVRTTGLFTPFKGNEDDLLWAFRRWCFLRKVTQKGIEPEGLDMWGEIDGLEFFLKMFMDEELLNRIYQVHRKRGLEYKKYRPTDREIYWWTNPSKQQRFHELQFKQKAADRRKERGGCDLPW
jgi:hypothetical protein